MSTFIDLGMEGDLFDAYSKLNSVATGLAKIIDGKSIEEKKEQDNFEWVGNLVGQMDLHSKHYYKKKDHLCGIALNIGPIFYENLSRLNVSFGLEKLHQTLISYGKINYLEMKELKQAHQVVKSTADTIFRNLERASEMRIAGDD